MPRLSAFRGLRFDLGQVGSLEKVLCPPRHLIVTDVQDELYKRHPANAVRLVANREELGDKHEDCFARAGRFLRQWQREGLLYREPDPAIYLLHIEYEFDGIADTFRGLICRAEIESLNQRVVVEPVNELKLLESCQTNLSPSLALYEEFGVQSLVDDAMTNVAPIEARFASMGRSYRIWPVTDIHLINEVTSAMDDVEVTILEGDETFSAAVKYREQLGSQLSSLHGANHLMVCLSGEEQTACSDSLLMSGLVFCPHDA